MFFTELALMSRGDLILNCISSFARLESYTLDYASKLNTSNLAILMILDDRYALDFAGKLHKLGFDFHTKDDSGLTILDYCNGCLLWNNGKTDAHVKNVISDILLQGEFDPDSSTFDLGDLDMINEIKSFVENVNNGLE